MPMFDNKKIEEINEQIKNDYTMFDELMDKIDSDLETRISKINKVNSSDNRNDNSVMLQVHMVEARKAILSLRENLALVDHWKARMEKN